MKKKLSVLFCLTLLLCSGCGQKTEVKLKDGKEVIASVKGYDVTAEELFEKTAIFTAKEKEFKDRFLHNMKEKLEENPKDFLT